MPKAAQGMVQFPLAAQAAESYWGRIRIHTSSPYIWHDTRVRGRLYMPLLLLALPSRRQVQYSTVLVLWGNYPSGGYSQLPRDFVPGLVFCHCVLETGYAVQLDVGKTRDWLATRQRMSFPHNCSC